MAKNTQEPIIRLKGVTNRFGKQTVHDALDFDMYAGEIVGVVGGSGSGKSVLLRTILGLRLPQAGEVWIKGQDITKLSVEDMLAAQQQWGVLFQNGALFSNLTVLENVMLPMMERLGIREDLAMELAKTKLQVVGLSMDACHKFPSELSGGMVKRAALARALALDPPVLFLDEPTAGLDPISASAFDELIKRLQHHFGLSVFLITHDVDTLVTICDRVAILVNKKIVSGTFEEIRAGEAPFDDPWIKEYFQGARMRAASAA